MYCQKTVDTNGDHHALCFMDGNVGRCMASGALRGVASDYDAQRYPRPWDAQVILPRHPPRQDVLIAYLDPARFCHDSISTTPNVTI